MDCAFNWEYKTVGVLINELTQGIEHTKQLRAYLSPVASTCDETQELLLQKIISSFEQSLVILKESGSPSQSLQPLPPTGGAIESPVSADRCPRSDGMKRSFKDQPELLDISKRRKSQPLGTELVRVSAESTGFECPPDDGYSWRKYGLKDILGATYPRSYYSCAFRHMQNCRAMKQVQRSDDDPSVFEIRYKGHHTCRQLLPPTGGAIESPDSADGCPRSDDMKRSFKDQPELVDISKRGKSQPLGTELVRVSAESTGFECPPADGYCWRKYGLIDVLGATYPRSYYRCAHRHAQSCRAMKQVQRSNDDPSVLEIRYKGHHTCRQVTNSPSFVSSHTTEPSYLHPSHSCLTDIGTVLNLHHSESDRTDIFSANTSTTSTSNP